MPVPASQREQRERDALSYERLSRVMHDVSPDFLNYLTHATIAGDGDADAKAAIVRRLRETMLYLADSGKVTTNMYALGDFADMQRRWQTQRVRPTSSTSNAAPPAPPVVLPPTRSTRTTNDSYEAQLKALRTHLAKIQGEAAGRETTRERDRRAANEVRDNLRAELQTCANERAEAERKLNDAKRDLEAARTDNAVALLTEELNELRAQLTVCRRNATEAQARYDQCVASQNEVRQQLTAETAQRAEVQKQLRTSGVNYAKLREFYDQKIAERNDRLAEMLRLVGENIDIPSTDKDGTTLWDAMARSFRQLLKTREELAAARREMKDVQARIEDDLNETRISAGSLWEKRYNEAHDKIQQLGFQMGEMRIQYADVVRREEDAQLEITGLNGAIAKCNEELEVLRRANNTDVDTALNDAVQSIRIANLEENLNELKTQLQLTQDERDRATITNKQLNESYTAKDLELQAKLGEFEALKAEYTKLNAVLDVSDTSVRDLEQKVARLTAEMSVAEAVKRVVDSEFGANVASDDLQRRLRDFIELKARLDELTETYRNAASKRDKFAFRLLGSLIDGKQMESDQDDYNDDQHTPIASPEYQDENSRDTNYIEGTAMTVDDDGDEVLVNKHMSELEFVAKSPNDTRITPDSGEGTLSNASRSPAPAPSITGRRKHTRKLVVRDVPTPTTSTQKRVKRGRRLDAPRAPKNPKQEWEDTSEDDYMDAENEDSDDGKITVNETELARIVGEDKPPGSVNTVDQDSFVEGSNDDLESVLYGRAPNSVLPDSPVGTPDTPGKSINL